MIIKGNATSGAGRVAAHLLRTDQNERAEVKEFRGVMSLNLRDALREMEVAGLCSRTKRPLYHASINPRVGESMTDEQWSQAIDRLEEALGLTGQPRAVIEHLKSDGRLHRHIVWSRIALAKGAAIRADHNYRKHEEVARELERAFGFVPVPGAHVERGGRERPVRTPATRDLQQGVRTGICTFKARELINQLWRGSKTGREFAEVVHRAGWTLCRGDRRDFVLLDHMGGVHSLARRVGGAKAADIRARMADLDPASLPSVGQARAALRPSEPRSTATVLRFPRKVTQKARQRWRERTQRLAA